MQFKEALKKLESSGEFKEWRKKNKDDYLVHGFATLVGYDDEPFNWQIGYYNKKTDKVTPFDVSNEISVGQPAEAFKKTESIPELEIEKVKLSLEDALKIAREKQEKDYKQEFPMKIFVVIQDYSKFKNIWNITLVTAKFNTLNIKVDSSTGKIKADKVTSFMDFKAK